MGNFDFLQQYSNRQVVLNVYHAGELVSRDGFLFEKIKHSSNRIFFIRDNLVIAELPVNEQTSIVKLPDFPDYYAIEQADQRTEIYFPH